MRAAAIFRRTLALSVDHESLIIRVRPLDLDVGDRPTMGLAHDPGIVLLSPAT